MSGGADEATVRRRVWGVAKRILLLIGCLLLLLLVFAVTLFWDEGRSLTTLTKLDDYGMFRMTYHGDYGFDDFLLTGADNDLAMESFVSRRLLKGLPIDLNITGGGCTAFVTRNEKGEVLFARNFDFAYAPSLQLFTAPENGYRSVSTVNLSFLGYAREKLPNGLSVKSFAALGSPYLPFDGMNENGVAIALLAVPEADGGSDPDKITLNTTTAIRLVLDHAMSADDAVALLDKYNIYFSEDIRCHYLIADATGRSVLVEFWEGRMRTVTVSTPWQIASNFVAVDGLNLGEGFSEFERYDRVEEVLTARSGVLTEAQAVDLLAEVGVYNGGEDRLQWSVVYNLSTQEVTLFAHRDTEHLYKTSLEK